MLQTITNVIKSGASFLQSGTPPPNTPDALKAELGDTNHLASKKFFMALSAFFLLGAFYLGSVSILFQLKGYTPELVQAFTVVFTKSMEVFALIMSVYLGVQGLVDLEYNSSSSVSQNNSISTTDSQIQSKIDEHHELITKVMRNQKDEDFSLVEDKEQA